jgi:hypothetical protein
MFTNEINLAISKAARSSRPISLVGPLRAEIESCAFLENLRGSLPWRSGFHHQLVLFSDASSSDWGGILNPGALAVSIRDYWQHTHSTLDINSKEIIALANVLDSFSSTISNSWVDAFTDSQVFLQSWSQQGAKSPNVIAALKQLFAFVSRSNIHLNLHHFLSRFNLADTPSRRLSFLDSMLSCDTWAQVQGHFGGLSGHSVDLMALPSMCNMPCQDIPFLSYRLCLRQGLQVLMFSFSFSTITHFFTIHMVFLQSFLYRNFCIFFPAMVLKYCSEIT